MRRKFKKNKSFFGLILFVPVLLLIILVGIIIRVNPFNINSVNIKNNVSDCVSSEKILTDSKIKNQNFFLLNSKKIQQNIQEKDFCIGDITINKQFPNRVSIEVSKRQPFINLKNIDDTESSASALIENSATASASLDGQPYLMDNQGVVFSKSLDTNIPTVITYNQSLILGKQIDNSQNILKILDKIKSFGIDINSSVIIDNAFIFYSPQKVIFNLDSNVDYQIASLQLILAKAKIDSSTLEFVDLRFDKPIIKIAPKKNG